MPKRIILSHNTAQEYLCKYSIHSRREYRDDPFALRTSSELARPHVKRVRSLKNVLSGAYAIRAAGLTLYDEPVSWEDGSDAPRGFCPLPLAEPLDVLISHREACLLSSHLNRHKWTGTMPASALWFAGKADRGLFLGQSDPYEILTAGPELAFVQYAQTLTGSMPQTEPKSFTRSLEHLKALVEVIRFGMELCGTYSSLGDWQGQVAYRRKPLTSTARIGSLYDHLPQHQRCRLAKEALGYMADGSASLMESALYLLLCLPRRSGGYGLPKPVLNQAIRVSTRFAELAHRSYYVPDLYWPLIKLDVEYDSTEFHDTYDSITDRSLRENALQSMGIQVRSVTHPIISRAELLEKVAHQVTLLLGLRWRPLSDSQRALQNVLRAYALPPTYLW